MAMTEAHRRILQRNHCLLVSDLDIDLALPRLYQEGVLSSEQLSRIEAEKIREDRCREFLRLLPRRGDRAFTILVMCIREHCRQDYIANKLEPEDLSHQMQVKLNLDIQ